MKAKARNPAEIVGDCNRCWTLKRRGWRRRGHGCASSGATRRGAKGFLDLVQATVLHIVKPKPPETPDGQKRSIGGEPGHDKHAREPFPPEQITCFETHKLDACPDCGGTLRLNPTFPRVVQQVDIEKSPLTIEQHTCPEYWCDRCGKSCWVPLPLRIERGGLVGPNLTALIAFMKGGCHASYSTIRTFLRDCVGVTLRGARWPTRSTKSARCWMVPYDELLRMLPDETVLNVDETGHKCNKELWWTWCLRADLYTIFKIDPHRSAHALMECVGLRFRGHDRLRLFFGVPAIHA